MEEYEHMCECVYVLMCVCVSGVGEI